MIKYGSTLVYRRLLKLSITMLLLFWAVVQLYPILFLFLTSFKTDPQILNAPFALPSELHIANYAQVLSGDRSNQAFSVFFVNSLMVTVGTLVLLLSVASLAGYALARGHFPGSARFQQAFLLCLAVPSHVLLIPMYFQMDSLGLRNNLLGLILLYATLGLPFTILLTRAYFLSIPREIEEQALIDGCTRLGCFIRIVLPISRGTLVSLSILNVTWIWGELFFALTLLNRPETRTLPLAVSTYSPAPMSADSVIGPQFAIMVLTALPLLLFYFVFQQHIRKGALAGTIR